VWNAPGPPPRRGSCRCFPRPRTDPRLGLRAVGGRAERLEHRLQRRCRPAVDTRLPRGGLPVARDVDDDRPCGVRRQPITQELTYSTTLRTVDSPRPRAVRARGRSTCGVHSRCATPGSCPNARADRHRSPTTCSQRAQPRGRGQRVQDEQPRHPPHEGTPPPWSLVRPWSR
jgi:hypothetical protein